MTPISVSDFQRLVVERASALAREVESTVCRPAFDFSRASSDIYSRGSTVGLTIE